MIKRKTARHMSRPFLTKNNITRDLLGTAFHKFQAYIVAILEENEIRITKGSAHFPPKMI
jgi:hypothetical protein